MKMEIVIVRHGAAVNIGTNGVMCDADRMLSDEGQEKTRLSARGLAAVGCRPDAVLSSPLIRAVETARIMGEELCPKVSLQESETLVPDGSMVETTQAIMQSGGQCVMVVGHMPHLADLVSWLLCGGAAYIPLKKASACSLLCEGAPRKGIAMLQWFITPRVLRLLAGTQ